MKPLGLWTAPGIVIATIAVVAGISIAVRAQVPAPPPEVKTYSISLTSCPPNTSPTLCDVQLIGKWLYEGPYRETAPLINKIQGQINAQDAGAAKPPAPPEKKE